MPPTKNDNDSDGEGDVSGGESEHSNSSRAHETSDEEANEMDSDVLSETDCIEIDKHRGECIQYMSVLEQQFNSLREHYYIERLSLIENQFIDVRNGRSEEYLLPLKELDKVYQNRVEVAEVMRRMSLQNIEHKHASEEQAALQHLESEKQLAVDSIYEDLMEKIRRLEEDRHNVDISWADWDTDKRTSKVRGPGRKKAVTVSGPYIIYMLRDDEIMEDWTTIRKALKRSAITGSNSNAIAT